MVAGRQVLRPVLGDRARHQPADRDEVRRLAERLGHHAAARVDEGGGVVEAGLDVGGERGGCCSDTDISSVTSTSALRITSKRIGSIRRSGSFSTRFGDAVMTCSRPGLEGGRYLRPWPARPQGGGGRHPLRAEPEFPADAPRAARRGFARDRREISGTAARPRQCHVCLPSAGNSRKVRRESPPADYGPAAKGSNKARHGRRPWLIRREGIPPGKASSDTGFLPDGTSLSPQRFGQRLHRRRPANGDHRFHRELLRCSDGRRAALS